MKSEWEFRFETRDFIFEREHKFKGTTNELIALGNHPAEKLEFFVRITPSNDKAPPNVEQVGSLFITLPYSQTETKAFAYHVAHMIADLITFQSGDFRIHYGLVICKHIAETPEEEQELGDKVYSAEMRLKEVIPPPLFESIALEFIPAAAQYPELISQFNETKRDTSPIRMFLGFFKILESLYHSDEKQKTLKQALSSSEELRSSFFVVVKEGNFDDFVETLVNVRHRCAHLKLGKGFGYVPADLAVEREVKPLLPVLAKLAHLSIIGSKDQSK